MKDEVLVDTDALSGTAFFLLSMTSPAYSVTLGIRRYTIANTRKFGSWYIICHQKKNDFPVHGYKSIFTDKCSVYADTRTWGQYPFPKKRLAACNALEREKKGQTFQRKWEKERQKEPEAAS